VDAPGLPVRVIVTAGPTADGTRAEALTAGYPAEQLLTDRGYDTNEIVAGAKERNIAPVIPPKNNRRRQRSYDQYLYTLRHLVENAFLRLKGWRGIATRRLLLGGGANPRSPPLACHLVATLSSVRCAYLPAFSVVPFLVIGPFASSIFFNFSPKSCETPPPSQIPPLPTLRTG
jgi:transposase